QHWGRYARAFGDRSDAGGIPCAGGEAALSDCRGDQRTASRTERKASRVWRGPQSRAARSDPSANEAANRRWSARDDRLLRKEHLPLWWVGNQARRLA